MAEVLLVLKRDTQTEPPKNDDYVWTDHGEACLWSGKWCYWNSGTLEELPPIFPPLWWLDVPRDAEGEGLTMEHLQRIIEMCEWALCEDEPDREQEVATNCLRAALKALATSEADYG